MGPLIIGGLLSRAAARTSEVRKRKLNCLKKPLHGYWLINNARVYKKSCDEKFLCLNGSDYFGLKRIIISPVVQ